jgi:transposase
MPRGRLSFRKGSTRSRMLFNVCAASRNSSLSSCRSGRWRRSWKPTRMRGASFLVAMTFAAEIGDVRRFDTPTQLIAFLRLVRRKARPATRFDASASP